MIRRLALFVALVGPAHAQEVAAHQPPSAPLNINVTYALFAVIVICLLGALLIWRSRSTTKGGTNQGLPISDKDLEALRISYGFWLVVGALLITLVVLVVTLTAFALPEAKTTDVVAIIGAVTGVIGTLTAAFFGIQAAGAGRSQAIDTLNKHLQNQGTVGSTPSKLDPSYGAHAGSTRVSITGNGFTGASGVNFGVTPGANFEFVNDGLVRANSPTAVDGVDEAKVVLVFPGTSSPNRELGSFYYYTIDPCRGGGGQSVTIRGSGLKDVKAVKFGNKEVSVNASTNPTGSPIKVTTPSRQEAGNIDDVDVSLIYPVDKPTNFFVIGKYHYGAVAGAPQSPVDPTAPQSPAGPGAGPSQPAAPGPDRFPASIALTLKWEGGNDDDPRDPGGRTSRGILQREWDVWRQSHPGLPSDVWQAPQDQILAIYRQKYWDPLACAQLPAGVDYCVFDYGVNSGIGRAAKVLQQVVGTGVDGEIGPLTLEATAGVDAGSLVEKICDQRLAFLKALRTWPVFGNGWGRRVEGVRKQAHAMVEAPTTPVPAMPTGPVTDPPWLVKARTFNGLAWASGAPPHQIEEWLNLIKTNSPSIQGLSQYCDRLGGGGYMPWCGVFVASMLAEAGLPPAFSGPNDTDRFAWAPAWDSYGTKVDIENGELPQPGDIMRFAWHGGGEHVTFYDHPIDSDDLYHCCGGNQGSSHVVSIEAMPMNSIAAVRRPPPVTATPTASVAAGTSSG
jgi:lysozyme family protein